MWELRAALLNNISQITANSEDHRRMRRLQAHAFSEKALKEQEPLITSYVDKMISRLREKAGDAKTATLDLVKWYNYTTFDVSRLIISPGCFDPTRKALLNFRTQILGELAFGDSFGCLEDDVLHVRISHARFVIANFNSHGSQIPFFQSKTRCFIVWLGTSHPQFFSCCESCNLKD